MITAPETVNQADRRLVFRRRSAGCANAEAPQATAAPQDAATAPQPTEAAKPAPAPEVQVSAVEIEGDRIFVAARLHRARGSRLGGRHGSRGNG